MARGEDERECPFCAETIKTKALKCRFCGERLDVSPSQPNAPPSGPPTSRPAGTAGPAEDLCECPFCAEMIKKKAVKCRYCGERLDGAEGGSSPVARPDSKRASSVLLAPGLSVRPPDDLRQKIRASVESLPAEERRIVTVVFIDLIGFTAFSREHDPEDVLEMLNQCISVISQCVYRYEGTVDKFLGDGVLAIFGAPITHEDDPQRAIRCSLSVHDAIANLPIARDNNVQYRIGINTGVVLAGRVGSDLRMEYTVIGDTVNIASRLQAHCRPGQILISESTFARTQSDFEFDDGEFYTVKGIPTPVKAFTVRGMRLTSGADYGRTGPAELELVGRQVELQHILLCVERLTTNRGQVVAIVADAGLGKSRLLRETQKELRKRSIAYWQGNCLSFGQNLFYLPFQEILRSYFGCAEKQTIEETRRSVEARISTPGLLTFADLELLMGLLGQSPSIERPLGEASSEQLADLLERLLVHETRHGPFALFFEDVHWIDQSSHRILDRLVGRLKNLPILLCCTHREGFPHTWSSRTYFTQISLQDFAREESLQMIDHLLGRSRIRADFLDLFIEKSGGNPFFLCELIHQMTSSGTLKKIDGVYQATQSLAEIRIPDNVHAVIAARMDALDDFSRAVLQKAAVIGRSFTARLLQEVVGRDPPIGEALARLRDKEFIQDNWERGKPEFIFKHGLTQEVAYESLLLRHRRAYHGEVARVIERLYADNLSEWYELLAHHCLAADDKVKALAYLRLAGEKAAALYATDEAIEFFRRYIQTYDAVEPSRRDPHALCEVQIAMGDLHGFTGRPAQALETYQTAVETCRAAARVTPESRPFQLAEARILRLMGRVHMRRGESEEARRLIEQALEVFGAQGDEAGIALATNDLGLIAWHLGHLDAALDHFVRTLEFSRGLRDRRLEANAQSNIALIHDSRGDLELALQANLDALEIRRQRQDPRDLAISLNNVGIVHERLGDYEKALQSYQEALHLARQIHFAQGMTHPMTNIGQLYLTLGDLDGARHHVSQTHDAAAESQDCHCHAMLHLIGANIELYRGRFQDALNSFDEAVRLTHETRELQRETTVQVERAYALIHLGQSEQSLATLDDAHRLIHEKHFTDLEATVHLHLAEAYNARGEPARALEHVQSARAQIETGHMLRLEGLCWQSQGCALLTLGRLEEARAAFDQGRRSAVKHHDALSEILASVGLARILLESPTLDVAGFEGFLGQTRRWTEQGGFAAFGWWPEYLEGRRAHRDGRLDEARVCLGRAVERIEQLAATLDRPEDRRAYLDSPEKKAVREFLQRTLQEA